MRRKGTAAIPGFMLLASVLAYSPWPPAQGKDQPKVKDDKQEMAKKELKKLEGTWTFIYYDDNGQEGALNKQQYVISNETITYSRRGYSVEGTLEIDPSTTPRHFDCKFKSGQTDLAIYTLAGDYLIICGHRDGETRPSEFVAGTEKGGAYVLVLRREK